MCSVVCILLYVCETVWNVHAPSMCIVVCAAHNIRNSPAVLSFSFSVITKQAEWVGWMVLGSLTTHFGHLLTSLKLFPA